jgi:enamine deaminase RidA (YjgF/YER057c/UK114 family)
MTLHINPAKLQHRSDAVIHRGVVHVSGAIPSDVSQDIRGQTAQVLAELDRRLAAAGTDKSKLLSATIWLVDVNRDVQALNEVWNAWLVPGREPARATVGAELQLGAGLEIAVIAAIPDANGDEVR